MYNIYIYREVEYSWSDQEDFDGADDVHGGGDGGSEVEEDADSAAELGTEGS